MPFLASQNKKFFIGFLTLILAVFSLTMLVFGDQEVALKTKASLVHAPHAIP